MPPKVKVTKDEIVKTSVDIIRSNGMQALNARAIASALNCSTQPIFSNFASMEELLLAAVRKADELYQSYIRREIASKQFPSYKASGMAYIRFAKDENELFKLLFMRDRSKSADTFGDDSFDGMVSYVQSYTGLNEADAKLFHLELWAFVHGIATMFATGFLDLDWELVSKMISDAYFGLRKRYGME